LKIGRKFSNVCTLEQIPLDHLVTKKFKMSVGTEEEASFGLDINDGSAKWT